MFIMADADSSDFAIVSARISPGTSDKLSRYAHFINEKQPGLNAKLGTIVRMLIVQALDQAEKLAGQSGLDRELSRLHYLRGNLHFAQGDGEACKMEHERALEFAQRAGDRECEAQALSGLGDAHYAKGSMLSAHAAFSRCVAICEDEGLARFAIMNNAMIAIIDTWLGQGDIALQRLARAGKVARELRHRLAEAMNEQVTGWMLVMLGRYDEADGLSGPPVGGGLAKTTGWIRRALLKKRGVAMVAGVQYDRIDDAGLAITVDGKSELLDVDTIVICAGQEPRRELVAGLDAARIAHQLIGGADVALELDAKRAIDQGTRVAIAL